MNPLKIAEGLSLPAKAVTQTFAILAMRGVGKTYTASVLAEEFSKAALPFAVLDPTGAWWGLRASADGKGVGYPVTILGGDHGDVPLEESAGKVIAALLAEEAPQLVIDLSLFTKSAMRRFVADFAEELYRKNRNPLHLIMDEADAFCPQKPRPDEMRMLGAIDEIVRRGRIRGLGCTLVTQRSAVLNKDVLTQMEVLVALRTAHPRDRAPILEWMKVHATEKQLEQVTETLATLPLGDAWIMSAGWLDLFKRVHIRERETFNSSATPEPGQRKIEPKKLAEVDLVALRERMAATIERAKADDPRELRRHIAALQGELRKRPDVAAADPKEVERVRAEAYQQGASIEAAIWRKAIAKADGEIREAITRSLRGMTEAMSTTSITIPARTSPIPVARPIPTPNVQKPRDRGTTLPGGERRILTALAQYPQGRTKVQIAILTEYAVNGGAFANYLGSLRSQGYIEGRESLRITQAGLGALGDYNPLPTGPELLAHWLSRLGKAERTILSYLAQIYPRDAAKETIGAATNYEPNGGGFNNAISRLRTLELVTGRTELRASEELMG